MSGHEAVCAPVCVENMSLWQCFSSAIPIEGLLSHREINSSSQCWYIGRAMNKMSCTKVQTVVNIMSTRQRKCPDWEIHVRG